MKNTNIAASPIGLDFIGWKAYNQIKKKAMEQKFSWSGLLVSLSIAFFIVLLSVTALNAFYQSIERSKEQEKFLEKKVYQLESSQYMNLEANNYFQINKNLYINTA